ncbi:MAG: hypothetical protein EOP07_20410 [Proteobacteria bacterium]|nr:MAG: hypothetical protein EOP07_20410 [Pseudomonadota bacterium]
MRQLIFSLRILLSLSVTSTAVAAEQSEPLFDKKTAKVYFRCESRSMDFSEKSEMHEVAPGRFVLSIPAIASNMKDKCVLSVVDGSSKGELSFLDFVPGAKDETVRNGGKYDLLTSANRPNFDVDFANVGEHRVEFDLNGSKLQLKSVSSTKTSRIIATR